MKTLNEQYQLIKEGKGHKGVFLNEAKRQFPNYIRNAATFEETATILKQRGVINENLIGITPVNTIEPSKKESFELAFEKFLEEAKDPQIKAKEVKGKTVKSQEEDEKAELKKPSKQVEEDNKHGYDHSDKKNLDNVIYGQMMKGYYAEMKDPKNEDKTMEQIRDIVLKNLEKDPMHYVKDGQFGVKGVGYITEHPGLGTPKEPTGKYKSSGYGDLKENLNPESLAESAVRKIVRAIINEELEEVRGGGNYGMITINTRGGGGERNVKLAYAPDTLDSRNELRLKRSGDLIWDEAAKKLFVSQRLYNNLSKLSPGNATLQGIVRDAFGEQGKNRNKIRTIIKDLYPVFSQRNGTLSNPNPELENSGTWISPINFSVERATSDSEKGYYRSGELLFFPYAKKDKTPKVSSSEEEVTETLKESIEKELAAINKEAEAETMQIKLDKINDAIEKRKSQLTKLDEDEDMKNLTDKKKVKELEKDIKKLEQAKSKVEKMMSKGKGKKKEVIEDGAEDPMMDEVEVDEAAGDLDPTNLAKSNAELAKIKGTLDTISKTDVLEDEEESEY